jgi:hypothetical protein
MKRSVMYTYLAVILSAGFAKAEESNIKDESKLAGPSQTLEEDNFSIFSNEGLSESQLALIKDEAWALFEKEVLHERTEDSTPRTSGFSMYYSRSCNTNYMATTDGFLAAYLSGTSISNTKVSLEVDVTGTGTSWITVNRIHDANGATIPVRKNALYRVRRTTGSGGCTAFFVYHN